VDALFLRTMAAQIESFFQEYSMSEVSTRSFFSEFPFRSEDEVSQMTLFRLPYRCAVH
jgi:hypothetical protein